MAQVRVKELVQLATKMEKKKKITMREKKGKRKDRIGRKKMTGVARIVRTGKGKEVRTGLEEKYEA